MGLVILAAIILPPLIEIAVFILVGSAIGVLPTVALTILTAVAGTALLRHQGFSLLARMQSEMDAGRVPGEDMMHGAMIVLAGLLLLLPGFVTDCIGLLLFIPPVRSAIGAFIVSRGGITIITPHGRRAGGRPGGPNGGSGRQSDRVVDLDESEWSPRDGHHDAPGSHGSSEDQPRISPWNKDD